jgi:hypothetical protein
VPPSPDALKKQIDDLEKWVRDKHKSGWTPTPKKVKPVSTATKKHPKRDEIPDDYEANIRIKKFLDTHPRATIREVAEEVKLSIGKVQSLDAWKRAMPSQARLSKAHSTSSPYSPFETTTIASSSGYRVKY